jgi:hypothetical protein
MDRFLRVTDLRVSLALTMLITTPWPDGCLCQLTGREYGRRQSAVVGIEGMQLTRLDEAIYVAGGALRERGGLIRREHQTSARHGWHQARIDWRFRWIVVT